MLSRTILMTTAAAALLAGAALAQSTDAPCAEGVTDGSCAEAAAESAGQAIQNTTDQLGDAANSAVEETGDALTATGEGIGNVADDAAQAMEAEPETAAPDGAEAGSDIADSTGGMTDAPQALADMTVGDVIGTTVVSALGEEVGEIDYVLGEHEGAPHAVIGIGGFLGLGEYTVALPLTDFAYDAEAAVIETSMTREQLEALPEIDESSLEPLPSETTLASLMTSAEESEVAPTTGSEVY